MSGKTKASVKGEKKLFMQLFVSGMSPKSMQAIKNIKHICDKYLKGKFKLEIIDIYKNPELAAANQIVFSPSLIKYEPSPRKILIGTFSETEKVLHALGFISEK